VLASSVLSGVGHAELYINEIFIDPPGGETPREYLELRGTPGMSLADHWLIVAENEGNLDTGLAETGQLDLVIDLSAYLLGSNGFLVMRRANNPYSADLNSTNVELPATLFENSGGTFMLIKKGAGPTPVVGAATALDGNVDNDVDPLTPFDGMDYPGEGQPGWTILDSVGVFVEINEVGLGRTYAPINFGPEADGFEFLPEFGGVFNAEDHFEPDATYVATGFENELIARYGNSSGQTERDWHLTNVTDNALAGYTNMGDFRQAAPGAHGFPRPDGSEYESSQYVPYGTNITGTLGAPNFPLNQTVLPWDYNQNGTVDAADYTVWRDLLGTLDPTGKSNFVNADRDNSVDQTDYDAWKWHFGESLPTMIGVGTVAVPEPASWLLAGFGLAAVTARLRRRYA